MVHLHDDDDDVDDDDEEDEGLEVRETASSNGQAPQAMLMVLTRSSSEDMISTPL